MRKRGISNGDRVRIFNGRGEVHIEAKVTPRMMPGVVALGKGPGTTRMQTASTRRAVLTY
jgi:anaerobic dimethyl sulfoxide reductase subunit A